VRGVGHRVPKEGRVLNPLLQRHIHYRLSLKAE
jgi:hypothetical protein